MSLRSAVPCTQAFDALVDTMELQKEIYGDNQNIFTGLGFSLDRKAQLKEFICKIPGKFVEISDSGVLITFYRHRKFRLRFIGISFSFTS